MSCQDYDACVDQERKNMQYPIDPNTLYGNGFYDDQAARLRCYERKPHNITEGFGSVTFNKVLKFVIILLVLFLLYNLYNLGCNACKGTGAAAPGANKVGGGLLSGLFGASKELDLSISSFE